MLDPQSTNRHAVRVELRSQNTGLGTLSFYRRCKAVSQQYVGRTVCMVGPLEESKPKGMRLWSFRTVSEWNRCGPISWRGCEALSQENLNGRKWMVNRTKCSRTVSRCNFKQLRHRIAKYAHSLAAPAIYARISRISSLVCAADWDNPSSVDRYRKKEGAKEVWARDTC